MKKLFVMAAMVLSSVGAFALLHCILKCCIFAK